MVFQKRREEAFRRVVERFGRLIPRIVRYITPFLSRNFILESEESDGRISI